MALQLYSNLVRELLRQNQWIDLIEQTHREVDTARVARGSAPYGWSGGPKRMMTDAVRKLREKYTFIVDLDKKVFDRETMESLTVEGVSGVAAPKQVCIKCGNSRHHFDTRGFCIACKAELGMPVYKGKSQLQEQRQWEDKRTQLANPTTVAQGQVVVDESLITFVWERMTEPARQAILHSVWNALPLADKARYIQIEVKNERKSADDLSEIGISVVSSMTV